MMMIRLVVEMDNCGNENADYDDDDDNNDDGDDNEDDNNNDDE